MNNMSRQIRAWKLVLQNICQLYFETGLLLPTPLKVALVVVGTFIGLLNKNEEIRQPFNFLRQSSQKNVKLQLDHL